MKITSRYGVEIGGIQQAYGTNVVKKARALAKRWNGKVVDLAARGRKFEKYGLDVEYTYRNT